MVFVAYSNIDNSIAKLKCIPSHDANCLRAISKITHEETSILEKEHAELMNDTNHTAKTMRDYGNLKLIVNKERSFLCRLYCHRTKLAADVAVYINNFIMPTFLVKHSNVVLLI